MLRFSRLGLPAALLLTLGVAHAEATRTIESARIQLADVATVSDADVGEIDLGPAPPPGSSRLLVRSDVADLVKAHGASVNAFQMASTVRVASAGRRFTPAELQRLVEPHVRAALPAGVTLTELRASRPVLASPRIEVGEVRIPRLMRRSGAATITSTVDLLHDGKVAHRLPVTLQVEQSAAAAQPLVRKGARVDLVIARGPARVSASAVALDDAELGEVKSFRVTATSKVLRARVESQTLALVVTP